MTDKVQFIKLPYFPDARGVLTVAEAQRHIPFEIKRVFWIADVPDGATRAGHSHALCHQALIAITGTVDVKSGNSIFIVADSCNALYIPPGNHIELTRFSKGAILLVLCSHYYDEED
jgi:dTDP-4-dehydrorhamnose 3,5-epimerase-like enzyme